MASKPHDSLVQAALGNPERAAGLLQKFFPKSLIQDVAWPSLAREPGSFVDEVLARSESDILLSVAIRGCTTYLYILIEHASTIDLDLSWRILRYRQRIWARFREKHPGKRMPAIYSAVLAHMPGGWKGSLAFEDLLDPAIAEVPELAPYYTRFAIHLVGLDHLTNDELLGLTLDAFGKLALWLLRDARSPDQFFANIDYFEALLGALVAERGIEALSQLLHYMASVGNEQQVDRFRATIRKADAHVEQQVMTSYAEKFIAEGLERGRAEGQQEGRTTALRAMLRRQLDLRFGGADKAQDERIEAASIEQLERFIERVITADSIDAVLGA